MAIQPIGSDTNSSSALYSPQNIDAGAPLVLNVTSGRGTAAYNPIDSNAAILSGIAEADIAKLTAILEPIRPAETATRVENLSRDATTAMVQGNVAGAIGNLNEIAALDPQTIEALRTDPVWAPVRAEIDHLLNHFTGVAKLEAEGSLARATQFFEMTGGKILPNWKTQPATLIEAAHRLFDAGGYVNYIRSADLSRAIVEYSPWMLTYSEAAARRLGIGCDSLASNRALQANLEKSWMSIRKGAQSRLQVLWMRAPLLVLLLAWLGLGLVVGPLSILLRTLSPDNWPASMIDGFYQVWGIGFLALVGLGFYARVRRVRL